MFHLSQLGGSVSLKDSFLVRRIHPDCSMSSRDALCAQYIRFDPTILPRDPSGVQQIFCHLMCFDSSISPTLTFSVQKCVSVPRYHEKNVFCMQFPLFSYLNKSCNFLQCCKFVSILLSHQALHFFCSKCISINLCHQELHFVLYQFISIPYLTKWYCFGTASLS